MEKKIDNSDQNSSTSVCTQILPMISETQNDTSTQLFADVENTKLNINADNHKPFDCIFKDMVCVNEKRDGLVSSFKFICSLCKTQKVINTENKEDQEAMNLNTAIVAGNMNKAAANAMEESAKEEAELAILAVCHNWLQKKKLLFLGVRNKYCSMCARKKSADESLTGHKCTKNWSATNSSSGMESSIIIEGFMQSEKMYGIRYNKFIADGNSSVYKTILEARPYKNLTVEKVECRNHLLRNLCNKLKDMTIKAQSGKLEHRKMLSGNILRIRRGIVSVIMYRRRNGHSVTELRKDITNSINHVFSHHEECASYFCTKNKTDVADYIEQLSLQIKNFMLIIKNKRFKKQLFKNTSGLDFSYGENAIRTDMDHIEFDRKKEEWNEARRKLLTASNFGRIISRRPDTGCENIVKSLLYNTQIIAQSLDYGRENEVVAKKELENILNKPIRDCGIFIDVEHFFSGATPDGLLDNDGLVEIKCLYSAANMTPDEGILNKKIHFWSINNDGSIGSFKKKHKHHYQIQGQMRIAQKNFCVFAVWTPKGIKTETILFDKQFWKEQMFPKLQTFFYDCLLPEIVDPRYPGRPIRNPQYIIDAQQQKKKTTKINININT
ncbi:YqaJ domain-containing protein [Aphis craccivora]|uniref:YqaJ domain-containing protein n=1 Tax=Aphis craccivora TaxID=307492 RepID=A0A6G0YGB3_APHCR|nr:YqaJ domain-containing protein [Aphis craccivora]